MGDAHVDVVGLLGGESFGTAARGAIANATVLVGSDRHLTDLGPAAGGGAERVILRGPLTAVLDTVEARAGVGGRVCVLASGDPGFFGIVRALGGRIGPDRLRVHPAPSSVALAFAQLGLSWDDAAVVSAHGRSLAEAVARCRGAKVAVLTSPDNPPDAVGRALVADGCGARSVAVVSRLGETGQTVTRTDLEGLAAGDFDPLSVLILLAPAVRPDGPGLAWGLPEAAFAHRDRMITKAEVRAVVLGKLALPATGVLWDLGAGSGSVAVEAARLRPGLEVWAVERVAADAGRIRANADAHDAAVSTVVGDAPDALTGLPDPDRVFVGGGGLEVLEAATARLRPGGTIVATFALVERAAVAGRLLGNMVQIAVSRGAPAGSSGMRLAAENPVFVCWGPAERPPPG